VPVSAPLTLPPSAALDVPQISTSRTSPFFSGPPPAPAAPPVGLTQWLATQWPVVAIGSGALVVGTVALWLMFSGGATEVTYNDQPVLSHDAAALRVRPGADASAAAAPRDAGAPGAGRAPRDAAPVTAAADAGSPARPAEPGGRAAHAEAPGLLSIQARPSATAILDGRKLGETPIYRRRTPSGWHTLDLRAPGLPALRRRIHIQPGREFKRTYELKTAKEK
jgi:hypothetical protein